VELEPVLVRPVGADGDDLGLVELIDGWLLEVGDLLAADDGRLVRVDGLVPTPAGSAVGGLAQVSSVSSLSFKSSL
jgi:hypothetical protein